MNKQFLKNLVAYISQTNEVIEKYATLTDFKNKELQQKQAERQQFNEKLAESIQIMKQAEAVPDSFIDDLYNSLRDNPVKVAEFLRQFDAKPPKVGESADGTINRSDDMLDFLFG